MAQVKKKAPPKQTTLFPPSSRRHPSPSLCLTGGVLGASRCTGPSHDLAFGLRDRLRVRLRVPLALRVRLRVLVLVTLALLLTAGTGALYTHCSPAVTSRPLAPPTWM